jgi:predicted ester cyclase
MSDGLKDRVRALYAAVNVGDLAAVEAVYDPERSWAPPGDQPLGRDAVLAAFRALRTAFPDFHDQVEALVAEDDTVVARVRSSGTHQGDFYGVAATGRRVRWRSIDMFRFADGRCIEHWLATDSLGLLSQLQTPGQETSS